MKIMTTARPRSSFEIQENRLLKPYTTFKIGGPARYFAAVSGAEHIREAAVFARQAGVPIFILGGGSNILVSDRGFDGLAIHPTRTGIERIEENSARIRIRIKAGQTWDDTVAYAVRQGWWGVENLSHIPGQSGAALVQNIGAYGQQLSDVFESAEVLELASGQLRSLDFESCGLGYRRSLFNTSQKGELVIISIAIRLSKRPWPNLTYRDVKAHFEAEGDRQPSQLEIRQAIIAIRDRKFPYPLEERGGNAGSFFKNPTLTLDEYDVFRARLQKRFGAAAQTQLADLVSRPDGDRSFKLPAAFLIDLCGLKGLKVGGAQVNFSQPLIILNLGGATADDVLCLAGHVRRTVYRETGVRLALEPELVGFSREEQDHYLGLG